MMRRRQFLLAGAAAGFPGAGGANSQGVDVVESVPRANAVIGRRSSGFFVRFNRPVDHEDSRLSIKHEGKLIEVLHPRLESAPEVLFARAPTLPPGRYSLHWTVGGTPQFDGEIPFTVGND